MIHWGFLILAFIAGFASCYGILYQLAKHRGQLIGGIERATKGIMTPFAGPHQEQ